MTAKLIDPAADRAAAHHLPGIDTEIEAARLIQPRAGSLRTLALQAFQRAGEGGLTDAELAEVTGKYLYTMAPRRVELANGNWVIDSGRRRPTPQGRSAIVWVLSMPGLIRLNRTAS